MKRSCSLRESWRKASKVVKKLPYMANVRDVMV